MEQQAGGSMRALLILGLVLTLGAEPELFKWIGLSMMLIALPFIESEQIERHQLRKTQ